MFKGFRRYVERTWLLVQDADAYNKLLIYCIHILYVDIRVYSLTVVVGCITENTTLLIVRNIRKYLRIIYEYFYLLTTLFHLQFYSI